MSWKERLEELKNTWNEVYVNDEFMEVEDRGEKIAIRINGCGEKEAREGLKSCKHV